MIKASSLFQPSAREKPNFLPRYHPKQPIATAEADVGRKGEDHMGCGRTVLPPGDQSHPGQGNTCSRAHTDIKEA